jgi:hypothetical protein
VEKPQPEKQTHCREPRLLEFLHAPNLEMFLCAFPHFQPKGGTPQNKKTNQ